MLKKQREDFMKKFYSYLALFGAAAFLGVSLLNHKGASVARAENEVPVSSIDAWKFHGGWGITSSYVADGVKAEVPGAADSSVGTANAWQYGDYLIHDDSLYNALSLSANERIVMEFSVGFYDDEGNLLSKSQNGEDVDIIFAKYADLGGEICRLRIWTNAGGALHGDHSTVGYVNGWNDYSAGKWIIGNATLSSKFTVAFDKDNMLMALAGGSDQLQPMLSADGIALAKTTLGDFDKVYVGIKGDNGFTAERTSIILRSINGQSLANDGTNFVDTQAPVFLAADVQSSIPMGEEYVIPTEAFDILGDVSYSLLVGDATDPISGKAFTPTAAGDLAVKLIATDAVGHSAEKTYNFTVVNTIEPPVITQLPTIANVSVEPFQELEFGMPTFTDSTGVATVKLVISKGDEEIAQLDPNSQSKFVYRIPKDFVSGEYKFVYQITNAGGTTTSNPITATFTMVELNNAEFVSADANSYAIYSEKGIKCFTVGNWVKFKFGTFDLSEGFDCKFIVDNPIMNGTGVYLHFINADNENYQMEYRVWPKFGEAEADAPTNCYVSSDGWVTINDITDTGWIKRGVDDVADQYHMAFNLEDTFVGERIGGMQRVDNAVTALAALVEAAPSYNYKVYIGMGGWGPCPLEATLSEVNGQKLAAPITWENAYLALKSEIPEQIAVNSELEIKAYAHDLRQDCAIDLDVQDPDQLTEQLHFVDGAISYTFDKVGQYNLAISTTGANGQKVTINKQVLVKTAVDPVTITVSGSYEATYATGSEITILPATYSSNVTSSNISVTKPDGTKVDVEANAKFTLAKPGLYKIVYSAQDSAEPEPNKAEQTFTINVPDAEKPVITVQVGATAKVGDTIEATISVADESDVETTVTLVKPDGTSERLTVANGKVSFVAQAEGTYTIRVVAEDIYGNSETVNKQVAVSKAAAPDQGGEGDQGGQGGEETPEPAKKKGCRGSIIATSSIICVTSIFGLAVLGLKKKQK